MLAVPTWRGEERKEKNSKSKGQRRENQSCVRQTIKDRQQGNVMKDCSVSPTGSTPLLPFKSLVGTSRTAQAIP